MAKCLLTIIAVVNLPVVLVFTTGCGVDCSPFYFETRSLAVLKAKRSNETSTELKYEYLHGGSSEVSYDSLIFDVYVRQKELLAFTNFSGTAIACNPTLNFQDQLSNINIYSDQDYNEDFPKGSNLNSLLQYRLNNELPTYDLSNFIDLINQQGLGRDHFLLSFAAPPSEKFSHDIAFEIELTNGKKFYTAIENIIISN